MNSVENSVRRFTLLRQKLQHLLPTGSVTPSAPLPHPNKENHNNPNILAVKKTSKSTVQPSCKPDYSRGRQQSPDHSQSAKQTKKKKKSSLLVEQQDNGLKLFPHKPAHSKTENTTLYSPVNRNPMFLSNSQLNTSARDHNHISNAAHKQQIMQQLQSKYGTDTLIQILHTGDRCLNPLLLPSKSSSRKLKAPNLYQMQMQGKKKSRSATKQQ